MIREAPVEILEQRLEQRPELRTLFELDAASESPRITADEPIREGQVLARFPLEMSTDLDLPAAWDITRGSANVVVAVMDTGIKVARPEFAGRLWTNPGEIPGNSIDDDGNGYVDDVNGWDTTSVATGGDANINDDDGDVTGHAVPTPSSKWLARRTRRRWLPGLLPWASRCGPRWRARS